MPSGPVLSETDKKEIKKKLQEHCEYCWIVYGYKKTSIKELCSKAGISIGTFYTLYPTKEELFFETIKNVQERLRKNFFDICQHNPTKDGFAKSMKKLFREYDKKPFLYNVSSPDFQAFMKKLSDDAMAQTKFDSIEFFRKAIHTANLNLKINEHKAYGIFSALLSVISAKETLAVTCNYFVVFDFMVDNMIQSIFE